MSSPRTEAGAAPAGESPHSSRGWASTVTGAVRSLFTSSSPDHGDPQAEQETTGLLSGAQKSAETSATSQGQPQQSYGATGSTDEAATSNNVVHVTGIDGGDDNPVVQLLPTHDVSGEGDAELNISPSGAAVAKQTPAGNGESDDEPIPHYATVEEEQLAGVQTLYRAIFATLPVFMGYASTIMLQHVLKAKIGIADTDVVMSSRFGLAVTCLYAGNLTFRIAHNIVFASLPPRKRATICYLCVACAQSTLWFCYWVLELKTIAFVAVAYALTGVGIGTFEANIMACLTPLGHGTKSWAVTGIPIGFNGVAIGFFAVFAMFPPEWLNFLQGSAYAFVASANVAGLMFFLLFIPHKPIVIKPTTTAAGAIGMNTSGAESEVGDYMTSTHGGTHGAQFGHSITSQPIDPVAIEAVRQRDKDLEDMLILEHSRLVHLQHQRLAAHASAVQHQSHTPASSAPSRVHNLGPATPFPAAPQFQDQQQTSAAHQHQSQPPHSALTPGFRQRGSGFSSSSPSINAGAAGASNAPFSGYGYQGGQQQNQQQQQVTGHQQQQQQQQLTGQQQQQQQYQQQLPLGGAMGRGSFDSFDWDPATGTPLRPMLPGGSPPGMYSAPGPRRSQEFSQGPLHQGAQPQPAPTGRGGGLPPQSPLSRQRAQQQQQHQQQQLQSYAAFQNSPHRPAGVVGELTSPPHLSSPGLGGEMVPHQQHSQQHHSSARRKKHAGAPRHVPANPAELEEAELRHRRRREHKERKYRRHQRKEELEAREKILMAEFTKKMQTPGTLKEVLMEWNQWAPSMYKHFVARFFTMMSVALSVALMFYFFSTPQIQVWPPWSDSGAKLLREHAASHKFYPPHIWRKIKREREQRALEREKAQIAHAPAPTAQGGATTAATVAPPPAGPIIQFTPPRQEGGGGHHGDGDEHWKGEEQQKHHRHYFSGDDHFSSSFYSFLYSFHMLLPQATFQTIYNILTFIGDFVGRRFAYRNSESKTFLEPEERKTERRKRKSVIAAFVSDHRRAQEAEAERLRCLRREYLQHLHRLAHVGATSTPASSGGNLPRRPSSGALDSADRKQEKRGLFSSFSMAMDDASMNPGGTPTARRGSGSSASPTNRRSRRTFGVDQEAGHRRSRSGDSGTFSPARPDRHAHSASPARSEIREQIREWEHHMRAAMQSGVPMTPAALNSAATAAATAAAAMRHSVSAVDVTAASRGVPRAATSGRVHFALPPRGSGYNVPGAGAHHHHHHGPQQQLGGAGLGGPRVTTPLGRVSGVMHSGAQSGGVGAPGGVGGAGGSEYQPPSALTSLYSGRRQSPSPHEFSRTSPGPMHPGTPAGFATGGGSLSSSARSHHHHHHHHYQQQQHRPSVAVLRGKHVVNIPTPQSPSMARLLLERQVQAEAQAAAAAASGAAVGGGGVFSGFGDPHTLFHSASSIPSSACASPSRVIPRPPGLPVPGAGSRSSPARQVTPVWRGGLGGSARELTPRLRRPVAVSFTDLTAEEEAAMEAAAATSSTASPMRPPGKSLLRRSSNGSPCPLSSSTSPTPELLGSGSGGGMNSKLSPARPATTGRVESVAQQDQRAAAVAQAPPEQRMTGGRPRGPAGLPLARKKTTSASPAPGPLVPQGTVPRRPDVANPVASRVAVPAPTSGPGSPNLSPVPATAMPVLHIGRPGMPKAHANAGALSSAVSDETMFGKAQTSSAVSAAAEKSDVSTSSSVTAPAARGSHAAHGNTSSVALPMRHRGAVGATGRHAHAGVGHGGHRSHPVDDDDDDSSTTSSSSLSSPMFYTKTGSPLGQNPGFPASGRTSTAAPDRLSDSSSPIVDTVMDMPPPLPPRALMASEDRSPANVSVATAISEFSNLSGKDSAAEISDAASASVAPLGSKKDKKDKRGKKEKHASQNGSSKDTPLTEPSMTGNDAVPEVPTPTHAAVGATDVSAATSHRNSIETMNEKLRLPSSPLSPPTPPRSNSTDTRASSSDFTKKTFPTGRQRDGGHHHGDFPTTSADTQKTAATTSTEVKLEAGKSATSGDASAAAVVLPSFDVLSPDAPAVSAASTRPNSYEDVKLSPDVDVSGAPTPKPSTDLSSTEGPTASGVEASKPKTSSWCDVVDSAAAAERAAAEASTSTSTGAVRREDKKSIVADAVATDKRAKASHARHGSDGNVSSGSGRGAARESTNTVVSQYSLSLPAAVSTSGLESAASPELSAQSTRHNSLTLEEELEIARQRREKYRRRRDEQYNERRRLAALRAKPDDIFEPSTWHVARDAVFPPFPTRPSISPLVSPHVHLSLPSTSDSSPNVSTVGTLSRLNTGSYLSSSEFATTTPSGSMDSSKRLRKVEKVVESAIRREGRMHSTGSSDTTGAGSPTLSDKFPSAPKSPNVAAHALGGGSARSPVMCVAKHGHHSHHGRPDTLPETQMLPPSPPPAPAPLASPATDENFSEHEHAATKDKKDKREKKVKKDKKDKREKRAEKAARMLAEDEHQHTMTRVATSSIPRLPMPAPGTPETEVPPPPFARGKTAAENSRLLHEHFLHSGTASGFIDLRGSEDSGSRPHSKPHRPPHLALPANHPDVAIMYSGGPSNNNGGGGHHGSRNHNHRDDLHGRHSHGGGGGAAGLAQQETMVFSHDSQARGPAERPPLPAFQRGSGLHQGRGSEMQPGGVGVGGPANRRNTYGGRVAVHPHSCSPHTRHPTYSQQAQQPLTQHDAMLYGTTAAFPTGGDIATQAQALQAQALEAQALQAQVLQAQQQTAVHGGGGFSGYGSVDQRHLHGLPPMPLRRSQSAMSMSATGFNTGISGPSGASFAGSYATSACSMSAYGEDDEYSYYGDGVSGFAGLDDAAGAATDIDPRRAKLIDLIIAREEAKRREAQRNGPNPLWFLCFVFTGIVMILSRIPLLAPIGSFLVMFTNGSIYSHAVRHVDNTLPKRYSLVALSVWLFVGDLGSIIASMSAAPLQAWIKSHAA